MYREDLIALCSLMIPKSQSGGEFEQQEPNFSRQRNVFQALSNLPLSRNAYYCWPAANSCGWDTESTWRKSSMMIIHPGSGVKCFRSFSNLGNYYKAIIDCPSQQLFSSILFGTDRYNTMQQQASMIIHLRASTWFTSNCNLGRLIPFNIVNMIFA